MARTLMIVEDERSQARMVQLALESEGYKTVIVNTLKGCLAKLEVIKPDLILLDIMLPDGYGTELLVKLRENAKFRAIPVLVTTIVSPLSGIREDVEEIYPEVGFLEKPFGKKDLLQAVRQYLKNER